MDIEVITSLIAAFSALFVAGIGLLGSRRNQRDVETLKATLAEQKAERDARREYEYEARKRLYEECEPLLFQLVELSEKGLSRIYSLARTAREGNLAQDDGWLSRRGYYMATTLYRLFAPTSIFVLIRRLLTLVDLSLDSQIEVQYLLTKTLYESISDDFEFAQISPTIEYRPNDTNANEMRQQNPITYWRQGLAFGRLDAAIESLLIKDTQGYRLMSFGEFETALNDQSSTVNQYFERITGIFTDFHPATRPVLWRMLITHAHIYEAIMRAGQMRRQGKEETYKLLQRVPVSDRNRFDWRQAEADAEQKRVLEEPFVVAQSYLEEHLKTLCNWL